MEEGKDEKWEVKSGMAIMKRICKLKWCGGVGFDDDGLE